MGAAAVLDAGPGVGADSGEDVALVVEVVQPTGGVGRLLVTEPGSVGVVDVEVPVEGMDRVAAAFARSAARA